jgi:leader peptidase (prepilin peptidase)/N-methyltransferase
MTWVGHLDTAAVCAVLCGGAALLLPRRIAALPEPEPEPDPTPEEVAARAARRAAAQERATRRGKALKDPVAEPPKEPYAELAARPRLAVTLVALAAASGVIVGLALGWDWSLLFWVPLVPLGAGLGWIDWQTRLLPVPLIYPAYAVVIAGVVLAALIDGDYSSLVRAGLGWLVMGGLYGVLWFVHPSGLGYGDVRLAGVLGIALGYLGWGELLVGLYAGFLLGGVIGAVLRVTKLVPQRHVPFGPFMLLGVLVAVVWGAPLWGHLVVTSG